MREVKCGLGGQLALRAFSMGKLRLVPDKNGRRAHYEVSEADGEFQATRCRATGS